MKERVQISLTTSFKLLLKFTEGRSIQNQAGPPSGICRKEAGSAEADARSGNLSSPGLIASNLFRVEFADRHRGRIPSNLTIFAGPDLPAN
jgi:hypothetical protein